MRWAREAEKAQPLRRRSLLDWAREIVGASAFVVGEPQGEDFALREIVGAAVPGSKHPFVVHIAGDALLMVHVERDLSVWQREFLEYVAEKLFGAVAEAELVPAARDELAYPEEMIIGGSSSVHLLLDQIRQTISSDLHILLRGESGTGKELYARMIHETRRPGAPFEAINCAAIPADLLEAEMFGIGGGVTAGVEKRSGHFVNAGGGTVFLDEIGDLPPKVQGKLLRVLQEREVVPVGSSVPVKIEAQIVASTNKNLEQMIRDGAFREDLYYRLRGLEFVIPPLRERREEIPQLVVTFAHRAAAAAHKKIRGVSEKGLTALLHHDWPVNVRQLKTAVERAVLMCRSGGMLESRHFDLPRESLRLPPVQQTVDLQSVEIDAIQDALRRTNGNKAAAARLLGITRAGLYLKLKRHGIQH